nr:immunoglobulin heavy chain junction region [Mus musculus]
CARQLRLTMDYW